MQCSRKSLWWILVIIWVYIFGIIISLVTAFIFDWSISSILSTFSLILSKSTYVLLILFIHDISLRIWKWYIITAWFVIVPYLMFPYIWYKLEKKVINNEEIKISHEL